MPSDQQTDIYQLSTLLSSLTLNAPPSQQTSPVRSSALSSPRVRRTVRQPVSPPISDPDFDPTHAIFRVVHKKSWSPSQAFHQFCEPEGDDHLYLHPSAAFVDYWRGLPLDERSEQEKKADHLAWARHNLTPYISASRSWLWALWEATEQDRAINPKRTREDVGIIVINSRALGPESPIEDAANSTGYRSQQYYFARASSEVLIGGRGIP
jgi:hypothetical protein